MFLLCNNCNDNGSGVINDFSVKPRRKNKDKKTPPPLAHNFRIGKHAVINQQHKI